MPENIKSIVRFLCLIFLISIGLITAMQNNNEEETYRSELTSDPAESLQIEKSLAEVIQREALEEELQIKRAKEALEALTEEEADMLEEAIESPEKLNEELETEEVTKKAPEKAIIEESQEDQTEQVEDQTEVEKMLESLSPEEINLLEKMLEEETTKIE